MSDGLKIIIALVGLMLVAAILLVRNGDLRETAVSAEKPSAGNSRSETTLPGDSADAGVEPSSENVSHSFFRRRKELDDLIEDNPADTTSIRLLAMLLQDAHQLEEAGMWYETYLEFRTSGRQVWLDLASVYAAEMNWDDAVSAMQRMLKIFPEDPAGQYNLGAIHANQGAFDEAKSWWLKVSLQSDDTELRDRAIEALNSLASR